MTPADRQAGTARLYAWLAAVRRAGLPDPAGAVAGALAVRARTCGPLAVIDPPPTIRELATATGRNRLAVRAAVSCLMAAGLVSAPRTGDQAAGLRLTLPNQPTERTTR